MGLLPAVIWGTDSFASVIAERFRQSLERRGLETEFFTLFKSEQDALREFRQVIADMRESLRSRQRIEEPQVVFIVSAFSQEALQALQHVAGCSTELEKLLPGSQSITLVVLLPPAAADDS